VADLSSRRPTPYRGVKTSTAAAAAGPAPTSPPRRGTPSRDRPSTSASAAAASSPARGGVHRGSLTTLTATATAAAAASPTPRSPSKTPQRTPKTPPMAHSPAGGLVISSNEAAELAALRGEATALRQELALSERMRTALESDGRQAPAAVAAAQQEAGRCTLTPPDPYPKGAWYPGGFNPCTCQVKNRFRNVPFKMQRAPLQEGAQRHTRAARPARGGAEGAQRAQHRGRGLYKCCIQSVNPVDPWRLKAPGFKP
jgi:hypothetical protein